MKKFQLWLMCAVGLASGPWSARSETDDPPAVLGTLTPDQQALLPLMDPEFAADCVALVQKAKTWKSRFTRIEAQARQISDDPRPAALSASQDDLAALVSDINTELQKCCTALRQHLKITEKIKSRLQEAEGQWRSAIFDPEEYFDVDEDEFRREVRQLATAAAGRSVWNDIDPGLFGSLARLTDPARYARSFVENEIKSKYFNQPYTVGDISITITQQNFQTSLFSRDANIKVLLDYDQYGAFSISGIYFAYRDGSLPEPKFDRASAQGPDLSSLANQAFSQLGDLIPDVGLGIKLEPTFLGYQPDKRQRRCGIQCRISVDGSELLDFIPGIQFKPKGTFTIYPTHPVAVVADNLDATIQGGDPDITIQLGTTPLELRGYLVTIDPRAKGDDKFLSIATNLGPSAGLSNAVSLAITIYCGLPVRGFAFDGKLVLGDAETIGTVSGKITPSIFAGNFTIPPADGSGLPIKALVNAKGKFTFDRDGLASNATAKFFQVMTEQAQLLLRPDGSGRFDFDEGLNLAGLHASGSVEATFANRFKNLEVVASLMVEVDGLEMFGIARASVTTTIHDAESIRVQWSALGMSDSFVMTRDQNLRDELKKELLARLPKGIQNLWNAAKDLDFFNRNSALRLGLAGLDVFNKNTDAAKELSHLGDVKNDLIKSIPGVSEVSDGVKRWGDGASNFVNKVLWFDKNGGERMIPAAPRFAPLRPDSLYRTLVPYQLTGLVAAGSMASADATVAARARAFATAVQQLDFHETPTPDRHVSGSRRLTRKTELTVKCDRATLAPDGNHDIVVALSLRCSGYHVTMNTQERTQRGQGAEMKWATVRLKNADDKSSGPRTVEINIPSLNANSHYTYLDVAGLIRDRLQTFVEQYLPDFSIQGTQRFYEKHLTVHNASDEPINVWVQGRAFTRDAKGYDWRWLPAEPSAGHAFKFVVPARSSKKLEDDVALKIPKISIGNPFKGAGPNVSTTSKIEHVPFEASRVRIWAESLSGDRQTQYHDQDCWLVPPNTQMDRERAYVAKQMANVTFTFNFPKQGRAFSERLVILKNETREHLTILDLRYRTAHEGSTTWHSLPDVELQPGALYRLTASDGSLVRASELRLVAEGEDLLFDQHRDLPLQLVTNHGQSRPYQATTIGTYEHVFRSGGHVPTNGK